MDSGFPIFKQVPSSGWNQWKLGWPAGEWLLWRGCLSHFDRGICSIIYYINHDMISYAMMRTHIYIYIVIYIVIYSYLYIYIHVHHYVYIYMYITHHTMHHVSNMARYIHIIHICGWYIIHDIIISYTIYITYHVIHYMPNITQHIIYWSWYYAYDPWNVECTTQHMRYRLSYSVFYRASISLPNNRPGIRSYV